MNSELMRVSPGLLLWGIVCYLIVECHLSLAVRHDDPAHWLGSRTTPGICNHCALLIDRPHTVSISEFGAIGDGKTLNTHAFENAIFYIRSFSDKGGAKLYIPPGKWLTGSFNLTSHLTLYLDHGAVILGSQDIKQWPVIDPLPSYGRGRELPGGRHMSLIHGENLTDVVITGQNGIVDGQGEQWWELYRNGSLDYTRPHLVEFISSCDILFFNVTFQNSPFWNLHPVYSNNVIFQDLTILAPHNSPNTDGIDPDSSTNVCIDNCYISMGDDAISIKSGWDEYGIAYGKPSANIVVRRVFASSSTSSGIAVGSEMSGGVANVSVHDMVIRDSRYGFRVKTAVGRGGYVTNITFSSVVMTNVTTALAFTGLYGDHPDDNYNVSAYPYVNRIIIKDVVGHMITHAGTLFGLSEAPFLNICLADIVLDVTHDAVSWNCSDVEGFYQQVLPQPCSQLLNDSRRAISVCSDHHDTGGFLYALK